MRAQCQKIEESKPAHEVCSVEVDDKEIDITVVQCLPPCELQAYAQIRFVACKSRDV
jgi:hypothetical protein